MPRIYCYKLVTDDGGAPCVEGGLLSLAICKPAIRRSAAVGDIVMGFAADCLAADNRLIYIAKITRKLTGGDYFRSRAFAGRGDCIYAWRHGRFVVRAGARYHGDADRLVHDLGRPPAYPRAEVLLSDAFVYWGAEGPTDYKAAFPAIARALEGLARGHRVNHGGGMRHALEGLIARYGPLEGPRILGRPADAPPLGTHESRCAAGKRAAKKTGRSAHACP